MKRGKFISGAILAYILVLAMLAAAIDNSGIGSGSNTDNTFPNADLPPVEPDSPATTTRSVLVELFTGTWCTFCRGAEGALDKLADEYYRTELSILEYHVGGSDPFAVAGNSERASYYGVTGYPTSRFDGTGVYVGGSTNPDDAGIYNAYKTRIDNRLPIPSPVTITVTGTIGGGSGSIDADITAIDNIPPGATDLKARFALYEDHNYSYYPPSQPTWEFRLRMTVVENMPFESITLTKEQSLSFNKPFTIDPAWDLDKLGAVVFVQSDATKEILGATSLNLSASSMKPDLTLTPQDISFSNPTPQDGDTVTIYATAHNVGTLTALSNVNVRFYDGDPSSGGTQIGTDQNAGIIAAGGSSMVQVDWDTTGLLGDHEICVVIDLPNSILEHENENNNIAPKSITVSSSPAPPHATSWSPTGITEPVSTDFDVQWTRVMNWNSVNSSFSYTDGMTTWFASDGSFTHIGATRTSNFNPTADLAPGTTYTVTFDTTATDQDGNPLDQDQDGTGGEVGQDELTWQFTTAAQNLPPTIEAWEPGGSSGQTYTQGDIVDITWSANDDNPLPANPINLTYGAGAAWSPIATGEANDGIYAWDTSGVPCPNGYWVNASVYDSAGQTTFDETNFSFTLICEPDIPPTMEAWEPGGTSGQVFIQGDILDVTWFAADDNPLPANPVNISYGSDAVWNPIASDEANDGFYLWDTSGVPCPNTYLMNISVFDSIGQTAFDESNFSFALDCPDNPPTVEAWEPGATSGQTFIQGDVIDVTWSATDDGPLPANPINISYGWGALWNPIANDEANDGIYIWDTSAVPCPGTYRMNVSAYDSASQTTFDEGNFSFTLNCVPDDLPTIEAWEPGGSAGQIFTQGDLIDVAWSASDDNPLPLNPINITYGSGASWTPIANDEANDGSYQWDTSAVPCPGTYWMNISAYDSVGQTNYDQGNSSFTIFCPGDSAPVIAVYEPGGTAGQTYTQGDIVDIVWSASDNGPLPLSPVNLTYRSGAVWTPIANDEDNDGIYSWDTSAVPCPATYWINASVYDSAGQTTFNEGNFSFTLNCVPVIPPAITATDPLNSATAVTLDQNVVITFSEAIDTATFEFASSPDPGGWTWNWNPSNTTVTGTHTDFVSLTTYTFTVTQANDTSGNQLAAGAVSNPWSWTTADATAPSITGVGVSPSNPEIGDDVTISATITDASGAVTVTVIVTDPDGNTIADNVTMPAGSGINEYSFGVPGANTGVEGTYTFTIWTNDSSGNFNSHTSSFDTTDSSIPPVTVTVTVSDKYNSLISNANIVLRDSSGAAVASGLTTNGVFETTLPVGTYTVKVSKEGYETVTDTFELTSQMQEHNVPITLEEQEDFGWLWVFIIIMIIVIVFLLLLVLLLIRRKKNRERMNGGF